MTQRAEGCQFASLVSEEREDRLDFREQPRLGPPQGGPSRAKGHQECLPADLGGRSYDDSPATGSSRWRAAVSRGQDGGTDEEVPLTEGRWTLGEENRRRAGPGQANQGRRSLRSSAQAGGGSERRKHKGPSRFSRPGRERADVRPMPSCSRWAEDTDGGRTDLNAWMAPLHHRLRGTLTVAVAWLGLPARSVATTVMVYTRPS